MRARPVLLAAGGIVASLAVTTTAATYALYSDFEAVQGNRAAAATVALGSAGPDALDLDYDPLVVDEPSRGTLTVSYGGTVPADVTLSLVPGAASAFCERDAGGWRGRPGLTVVVTVGGADPVDYCSLLDGPPVDLATAVQPGSAPFTTDIDLTLTGNTTGEDGIVAADALVIEARGGFTDRAEGTLTAPVEDVPAEVEEQRRLALMETTAASPELAAALVADPPVLDPAVVPEECAGTAWTPAQVVLLGPGDTEWDAVTARGADSGPLLIVGTDQAETITGSAAGDCIVGGAGDDRITGGDGDDVLLGGDGADILDGGPGDDRILGGAGPDTLHGGPGTETFDGGPDGAVCDGGPDGHATGPGCDPAPVATVAVPTTEPNPEPNPEPGPGRARPAAPGRGAAPARPAAVPARAGRAGHRGAGWAGGGRDRGGPDGAGRARLTGPGRGRSRRSADPAGGAGRPYAPSSSASRTATIFAAASRTSVSGSESATTPHPANSRAVGPSSCAHRSAMPSSPSPLPSTQPTGPA